jgi:hypothetical protein
MYAASQEEGTPGPDADASADAGGTTGDDVSDVEFEEVEDKDK